MDTRLLKTEADFEDWKSTLPANRELGNDKPESYPCIIAWVISDDPNSGWWFLDYDFIYPSDFEV